MATLGFFFPKESFCRICTALFSCHRVTGPLLIEGFPMVPRVQWRIFLDITKQNKQTTLIDRCPTTAMVTLDQAATTPGVNTCGRETT